MWLKADPDAGRHKISAPGVGPEIIQIGAPDMAAQLAIEQVYPGRAGVLKVDPADVGGINAAGADVFADDRAIGGFAGSTAPIQPAEVRAPGVFVDGINRRGSVDGE